MIGVDCLDEPPLAVDLVLGDNTPATLSSRTSNNAHVPRINLLASSSNFLHSNKYKFLAKIKSLNN